MKIVAQYEFRTDKLYFIITYIIYFHNVLRQKKATGVKPVTFMLYRLML